ncbi:DUF3667 domain-containing protein [Novosphingobium album (ex Hu et al. 2023)]|uniref:DUF3667 domain-containing protein n=1 Tax=Novosphingobium album (ex Hu et al. 2023) TaxID=2930093 RepID=A0ABT0B5Q0_9SPHN|nr:DUF3667 domain-containing protein [Novosphingobium album (ex Hu et al. 2023)]MCJ2180234.1 DUF3667 domain-containing protein [Novosphingobium album (ex Hu et al. 2023)]
MNGVNNTNGDAEIPPPNIPAPNAVDPGHTHERACLDCGTTLTGKHCQECGQKAHLHRTIGAFWHDLLHGVLHFDAKSWHTLKLLAWRPGELTRRYIDGERTKFISPIALFLFSIFLMFAVFQISGVHSPADMGAPTRSTDAAAIHGSSGKETFVIGEARDGTSLKVRKTGWPWIDKGLAKWHKNPGLMLYKLQSTSYKFSWCLILISIPFVWLLFAGNRRFNSYDHTVFITYSISFITVMMSVLAALYRIGLPPVIVGSIATISPPLHLYRHLRGTYGLTVVGTLWRLVALLLFIALIIALFLQFVLLIGIAG